MSKAIRVAVHDALFCINTHCRFWISSSLTGPPFVDCTRKDCDNHKRGPRVLEPIAETALPKMPEGPFSPE